MLRTGSHALAVVLLACFFGCGSCAQPPSPAAQLCQLVEDGFGPKGTVPVKAEAVVSGLEVPWALAFLPGGDWLVTERAGTLRLIRDGALVPEAVATLAVEETAEGGLLGLALDPQFASNRRLYLYATVRAGEGLVNRVERWILSEDHLRASFDRIILDGIPAARVHDGGRLRIGPDQLLYVSTGDAAEAELAQQPGALNGKLLRITLEGEPPGDNPDPQSPVFLLGVRNSQGFDWLDEKTLAVVDHGPTGERLRRGRDEVNLARAGDNLGWPTVIGCEARQGLMAPQLSWKDAVPPGGAAFYRGEAIPQWKGSLLVGTLGSRHLHRVEFAQGRVRQHEVYFQGSPPEGLGRLREVVMGPDGHLYVTTSNCDGRGSCPSQKDQILRIVPAPP